MLTMTRTSSSTSDSQVGHTVQSVIFCEHIIKSCALKISLLKTFISTVYFITKAIIPTLSADTGPQGWIVGSELLEDSFYISTNIRSECPAGIVGAFDSDNVSHDPDFSIECHR